VQAAPKLSALSDECGLSQVRTNKIHPALKHAGYSATSLLPGEDSAAFEKLHRALIAEFTPVGALEEAIVAYMARPTWRKQNLATFRIAELAQWRREQIDREKVPQPDRYPLDGIDPTEWREEYRAAAEQARRELGDTYKLIDIGKPATINGLMEELNIEERLDGLLLVRGVKSLSPASSSASTPQISGSRKAG
jgi:hypothetical protein